MVGFGIGVAIDTTAGDLSDVLGTLAGDQVPFAGTVALTRMAQDVKAAEIADLPLRFNIHGKRLERGIRLRRAEKRDWPNPRAEVGSLDEFLVPQEFGGTKKATKGASHVAIPARYVQVRRDASTGRFPRKLKPRGIPKSHKVPEKGIFARPTEFVGPVQPGQGDRPFWFLKRSVTLKPKLKFRETASKVARETYSKHFERELLAAVKSARVRATRFSTSTGRFLYRKALASL